MPIRVLIIDDDEDDVILTRELLREGTGGNVLPTWAGTFDDGLAKLQSNKFDVALVDYRLGADTGLDLLRATGSSGTKVPMIVLTGQADHEIDLEAMRAGAADYLRKGDLTAAGLDKSIRYAIQSRRLERQRLRLAREQSARRAAEAANQAKDDFLALLSHELRTPLNAISNWVQLLELDAPSDIDEATLLEAINAIGRNVRLQAQLVDDLLDVSRIVAGKLEFTREPVDLATICREALEGCRPLAHAKRIKIETDLPEPGELRCFMGDPTRLQQIVWNLANNAVKFTDDGGSVSVTLKQADPHVLITVQDDGPGITEQDLPFIFDRFRQGASQHGGHGTNGNSGNGRPGGLGLGLALVRHLTEVHGGSVEVRSDGPGTGSSFTVTLPVTGMPESHASHASRAVDLLPEDDTTDTANTDTDADADTDD